MTDILYEASAYDNNMRRYHGGWVMVKAADGREWICPPAVAQNIITTPNADPPPEQYRVKKAKP